MNPSLLWVDPNTLNSLFTHAGFPVQQGSSFPSFSSSHASGLHAKQVDTGQLSNASVSLRNGASVQPLSALPQELLEGETEERLNRFVVWLAGETNANAVFLSDEEGLPVAAFHAEEEYSAWSASLQESITASYQTMFSQEQAMALSLESIVLRVDHMFCLGLLWAKGFQQTLVMGLFLPYYPETNLLDAVRDALHAVLHEVSRRD